MGEHDQAVLHDEDAHQSIHDDGRTLRQGGLVYNSGYPVAVPEPGAKQVFIYRGKKLIPDTVYIHSDAFLVTEWESLYSSVFTLGDSNFSRASFAPIVDDHWRVVGHLGWADGNDILVPEETVRNDRHFWSILQEVRLGEERQQILDEAFLRDRRRPFPNFPFPPPTTSPPPLKDGKRWRGPENCVPRPPTRYRPTREEQARSGPLKEEETDQYLHDLDKFVNGGGKAFVGRHFLKREFASYLDPYPGRPDGEVGSPKMPFSSGYEFLVLVDPDGNLQGVMDIRKNLTTQHERDLELLLGLFDLTMTILMVIDIVPIVVVLFRLGARIAMRATIQAVEVVIKREAKAALDLAMQRVRRELELAAADAAAKAAEELAVETIVVDAKTEARWAARGNRLRVPESGGGSKSVGELWREGGAEAEGFSGRSGAKGPQAPRTDLTQPPRHVMKPEPIEDLNKGIPDHLKDASPAEKRKWIESPEGKKWRETKRLDGPSNNLDTQPPHAGPRDHDAEANMFEKLKAATNRDTVGEFHFKVDRPVCPACKDMILRFAKERPKIKVIQHSLDNKLITP